MPTGVSGGGEEEFLVWRKVLWSLVSHAYIAADEALFYKSCGPGLAESNYPDCVTAVSSGEITWLEARTTYWRMLFLRD